MDAGTPHVLMFLMLFFSVVLTILWSSRQRKHLQEPNLCAFVCARAASGSTLRTDRYLDLLIVNTGNDAAENVTFSELSPLLQFAVEKDRYALINRQINVVLPHLRKSLFCRREAEMPKGVQFCLISHSMTVNYNWRGRRYSKKLFFSYHDTSQDAYYEIKNELVELGVELRLISQNLQDLNRHMSDNKKG